MTKPFSDAYLDGLLECHEVRQDVDRTIEVTRALGLDIRPDTLRQQAALHEVEPDRAELTIALVQRRLAAVVTAP